MRDIDSARWHADLADQARDGWSYLDLLTLIDRGDRLEIVARVVHPDTAEARLLRTFVAADEGRLASVADIFPAAGWQEREAAELFGIRFIGHPDPRPLLTDGEGPPLLRKATPLPARLRTPWPGEDASARRRGRVPGVPDSWREADQ